MPPNPKRPRTQFRPAKAGSWRVKKPAGNSRQKITHQPPELANAKPDAIWLRSRRWDYLNDAVKDRRRPTDNHPRFGNEWLPAKSGQSWKWTGIWPGTGAIGYADGHFLSPYLLALFAGEGRIRLRSGHIWPSPDKPTKASGTNLLPIVMLKDEAELMISIRFFDAPRLGKHDHRNMRHG